VVAPVVIAAIAWRCKSIYLIDGALQRIIACTDHLKALQFGFSVYVLHQSTLIAYAAGAVIG